MLENISRESMATMTRFGMHSSSTTYVCILEWCDLCGENCSRYGDITTLTFILMSVFATVQLDHLPATNLNMFTHLLTNKETSTSTDYLELSIAYLKLTYLFHFSKSKLN